MTPTTTNINRSDYAYCSQPHPGGDAEARDWHDRYHIAPSQRPPADETDCDPVIVASYRELIEAALRRASKS